MSRMKVDVNRNANEGAEKVTVVDKRRISYPVQEMATFSGILAEVARQVLQAEAEGFRLTGTSLGVVEMIRSVEPPASSELLDVMERVATGS